VNMTTLLKSKGESIPQVAGVIRPLDDGGQCPASLFHGPTHDAHPHGCLGAKLDPSVLQMYKYYFTTSMRKERPADAFLTSFMPDWACTQGK
jgi:hypothetical protein